MQINNRFIDDLARVASGALGVASGVRDEVEAMLRERFQRYLSDLSLVTREEFDAVKEMAARAREGEERLIARLAELERRVAVLEAARMSEPPVGDADPSLER
ncbi:MAG: accessory factor UbiK family protein [Gemmatimonas sp.]